ncbi:MAG: serine/threonine-protein kinase, partial [Verrucomicrobiota bacterium]
VRGIPIHRFCDEHRLTTMERIELFVQVCQAVQHAHQKGIIHRDLKPSNILVTEQDGRPVPKVIDFGVAKATEAQLTEKTLFTHMGQMIGTPAYMSPEQAGLGGLDVDTRSDIYSLGVILYEILTGHPPFETKRLLKSGYDEVLRTIREVEPQKPSTKLSTLDQSELKTIAHHRRIEPQKLNRVLRGELDWIVLKALDKDRSRRYETANGMALDLKRYLHQEPVLAAAPNPFYRLRKLAKRHRLAFSAAAGMMLLLLLGIVTTTSQMVRANRHAQRTQQTLRELATNLYAADIYLAQNAIREGNYGFARQTLLGHLPQPGSFDLRGFEWRYFWRLCQGDKLAAWPAHSNVVQSVAVSPDGKWIASAGRDHEAKVWQTESFQLAFSIPDADAVVFSADSAFVFTASENHLVQIWNTRSGKLEKSFSTGASSTDNPHVRLSVSPSAPILAVCTDGHLFGGHGSVRLYDFTNGALLGILPNSGDRMSFSGNGNLLVTGSVDRQIKIWDVANRSLVKTIGPVGGISGLAVSPDGLLVASTEFWQDTIRLWDVEAGNQAALLRGHRSMVWEVVFSPDGNLLASGSSDQTIRLWDAQSRREMSVLTGHGSEVWSLAFFPGRETLISGSKDESVAIWPTNPPRKGHAVPLGGFRHPPLFSGDGRMFAVPGETGGVNLVDASKLDVIRTYPTEHTALWFGPDGKTLLTLGTNGALHTIDLVGDMVRETRPSAMVPVTAATRATASKDGKQAMIFGNDQPFVSILNVADGLERAQLKGEIPRVNWAVFSPTQPLVAVCGVNLVELWDLESKTLHATLHGHKDSVSWVEFSSDGNLLASASVDNTTKIWSIPSGREITTLRGHREGVLCVGFSPDGKTLATSSGDRTIKLWNVQTWREIASFPHTLGLWYVAFAPDNQNLAFGCDHRQVTLMHAPPMADIDGELRQENSSGTMMNTTRLRGLSVGKPSHRLVFRDEFNGSFQPGWMITNAHPENLSFTKRSGNLTITTEAGGFYSDAATFKNLLLLPNPVAPEYSFETSTTINPCPLSAQWHQMGLLLWDDADHYVKWVLQWHHEWRQIIAMPVVEWRGEVRSGSPAVVLFDRPIRLGVTRRARRIELWVSQGGEPPRVLDSVTWPASTRPAFLGLVAKNGHNSVAEPIEVSFDDFEVRVVE